jgi:hypothetical protein
LYSLIENLILSQLANKQSGIRNVVKTTKNKEIPSTPIKTLMLESGTEKKGSTNWYLGVLKSKLNHKKREIIKTIMDVHKLNVFTKLGLVSGIIRITRIASKGKVIKDNNIEGN